MSRPFASRNSASASSFVRVNGKIRAREVRVIGDEGQQLGVFSLHDAIKMAQSQGVDLVEIAPNATPPVCRVVDYGKFRYEQAKKDKESRKHQHANKLKEIQLSAAIDPHDFGVKLSHAVDFLCEEMKVKVALKFRGREMAHQEYGFKVVNKFLEDVALYGHPDAPPKLIGKGLTVVLSPLPRNKRAKHPKGDEQSPAEHSDEPTDAGESRPVKVRTEASETSRHAKESSLPTATPGGFVNNPFAALEAKLDQVSS
ncbi:MAG: translation initiation factor IF-3 [Verrucomicrobia bacterium]|nr:translation initiation factor IF-3 [Verrucomicrobiota bacterium]